MAKKGNRVQVILECTEHKASGVPGTSRYITTKNKKNTPDRMELKKYNPILNKMTIHNEKSLVVYLNREWENLNILESKEWNCYESSATIQNVKTIKDIFEVCNLFKRSEMIPNQTYPTEFVNMYYDLHIRRIL